MSLRPLTLSALAAGAMALALAAAPASAQQPREKFTLALNWFAVGDHAAYWVALEKGYYAQKGLDVSIEASKGSPRWTPAAPTSGWPTRCRSSRPPRAAHA